MSLARKLRNHTILLVFLTAAPPCLAQVESSPSDAPTRISSASTQLLPSNQDTVPASLGQSSTAAPETDTALPLVISATDATSRALQSIIVQAMNNLDVARIPKLDEARSRLSTSISRLEKFVNLSSSNGQAWNIFLKLDTLKKELAADKPDLLTLVDLQANMRQNYVGLEYLQFVEVREALSHVIAAMRYGSNPAKSIEVLEVKLRQLFDSLNEPISGSGTDRNYAVALMANYLYEMKQTPAALSQIRSQFSTPNFRVTAREDLVNRLLARSVAEPNPVNECLLGTRIIGQACLLGSVSADLRPMLGGISVALNLNGNISTKSQGYNRGVVLGSTATSPVFVSKQIFVTPTGISSSPATVCTNLQTSINSIDHRLGIVRRIAKRKAAEQKPLADAIAQGRLQSRISTRYDSQVDQQLSEANVRLASFRSQPLPELGRLGISRPTLDVHSTDSSLHGDVVQAAVHQLAADRACTIPKSSNADIFLEAHQSAVVNALDIVVGDRTIRNVELGRYAEQIAGKIPEDLKKEIEGEEWSVTLATFRPVDLEFDDGKVTVKLRTTRMSRGDQTLEDYAMVTAVYRPSYANGRITLTREGEVDLNFPRTTRVLRQITLRSFLKTKFNEFFKEEIVTQPIDLKKAFPNAPSMSITSLQLDDGWLQLGVR